jgi:ribosomal-protein-alanine acetyltransferase
MAVLQRIRDFFTPHSPDSDEFELIVPAPPTEYAIRPLTTKNLDEVLRLNQRCFKRGEHYGKHVLSYLLAEPTTLSYRATTPSDEMTAFAFITLDKDGTGHITTIGVAPEHRRRGLARQLILHAEESLRKKGITLIRLEVRVSNVAAQSLYRQLGYAIVQRLNQYYTNGEDGFLMVKSLF